MLASNISAQFVLFRFWFLSIIFVTLTAGSGFYLRLLLYFINLRWCRMFFFPVSFESIVFWISLYSALPNFFLSIESVWSILSFLSLTGLLQNVTTWFINVKENPFRLKYHLSIPGRNFQLLVQVGVVNPSEKFYFWCIRTGNLSVKHTLLIFLSISSVWLLIHPCCAFEPVLEKLLKNFNFS